MKSLRSYTGLVSAKMAAYLRVCDSGGMPSEDIEKIMSNVAAAEELGYFDELQKKPEPEPKIVTYTSGHCKENAKEGGCQLHNLHCGYPECDRKKVKY